MTRFPHPRHPVIARWPVSPLTPIGCALVALALSADIFYPYAHPGFGLSQVAGVGVGIFVVLIDLCWYRPAERWNLDALIFFSYLGVILVFLLIPVDPAAWHRKIYLDFASFGARDTAINLVAFLPLGLFLAPLLERTCRIRRALRLIGTVTTLGFAFSLAVETAQFWWIAGRYSSALDLAANTLGFGLGAALFVVYRARHRPSQRRSRG